MTTEQAAEMIALLGDLRSVLSFVAGVLVATVLCLALQRVFP